MSRQFPYAKALMERQVRGDRPWLVTLSVGNDAAWRATILRLLVPNDPDVARLWWPDNLSDPDLAPLIGLDVLVADCGAGAQRVNAVLYELWRRANLATLWLLQHPERKWLHLSPAWAKFRAARVLASPVTLRGDPLVLDGIGHPIDDGLRERVGAARETALFRGEPPLFDQARFVKARQARVRELGLDLDCFAWPCGA